MNTFVFHHYGAHVTNLLTRRSENA